MVVIVLQCICKYLSIGVTHIHAFMYEVIGGMRCQSQVKVRLAVQLAVVGGQCEDAIDVATRLFNERSNEALQSEAVFRKRRPPMRSSIHKR